MRATKYFRKYDFYVNSSFSSSIKGDRKMLLHMNQNRTKLYRISLLLLVCFAINACSTVDIKYINRETVKSISFAENKPFYREGESKPTSLGALRFTNKDAREGDSGKVYLLQRKRGVYMTETKIGDTGKKRYFLSVGVNPSTGKPAIGFRMEF